MRCGIMACLGLFQTIDFELNHCQIGRGQEWETLGACICLCLLAEPLFLQVRPYSDYSFWMKCFDLIGVPISFDLVAEEAAWDSVC